MPLPTLDLADLPDADTFTGWRGIRVDVWRLYDTLTSLGWKVDTEESNLMVGLSKTWRAEGVKVWIYLEKFVCAPPDGEVEAIDFVRFYRFDPEKMPTGTMHEKVYDPGDEQEPWYPSHREEWGWLIEHGDPQFDTFDLLAPIPLREVPPDILLEAWADLEEAVVPEVP